MSVTIMDILKNADYNFEGGGFGMGGIAHDQLHNAIILLNKGYDVHITVDVDELVKKYGSLEAVPEVTGG